MERVERAVAMFREGFSCAQSLLAVFGPAYGVEREAALRLAAPLAGGVSRTDGPCGAATGAILVLGLAHGPTDPDDEEGSRRILELTQEFLRRYDAARGSTMCTDILGVNLAEPGVAERAKADDLFDRTCPDAVRTAGTILLDLL